MSGTRVILITGTRTGLGRYLAEHFARKGDRVFGCSRSPTDLVHENYGHRCMDVADEDQVLALFEDLRRREDRLDVLINNAGVAAMNFVVTTPLATVRNVLNTNAIGTFLFCREAAKTMMARRSGQIVNLSSIHVPLALPGSGIYGASKAFVEQLSKVLAEELAPFGIRVRVLGLSVVNETGMRERLREDMIARIVERTEAKRCLELEEVAAAVDDLLAPAEDTHASAKEPTYLGGLP